MRVLLVYPAYPDTFWSFRHALKLISKKATHPPLGLLIVASLLPKEWSLKLIDLNVEKVNYNDFKEADFILISGMSVQRDSAEEVIAIAKRYGKKIIAGGPLFTTFWQDFYDRVDHLILNEAEITLPLFLEDLQKGAPKKIYRSNELADLSKSPLPAYHLINLSNYTSMCIQYSRGCPFNCEFCDVTNLFGHQVRTKTVEQIIAELDNLYKLGWRGSVFFVDDNFIGGKNKVKKVILPAILHWQKEHRYPFYFYTQVSINLADDEELMDLMAKAGFTSVFIGIETPHEESLKEANKVQNRNRNLIENISKIQQNGLEVMGGFIIGFDNDPPDIFQRVINFVKESTIVIAMVGLLNAPPGTKLYKRLISEGRIKPYFKGDNTDFDTNIIPKMDYTLLIKGYKKVIRELYLETSYYQRIYNFLNHFKPKSSFKIDWSYLKVHKSYLFSLPKIIMKFGLIGKERLKFWKLLLKTILKKPRAFSILLAQMVSCYHIKKIYEKNL
ncbi:MAG: B12-binding domain-containing radical SAM protein [Caldimicrobium sp.]